MIGRLQFRAGRQCGWRTHTVGRSHLTTVVAALSRCGGGGWCGVRFRSAVIDGFQLEAFRFGGSARVAGIIGTGSAVDGLARRARGARVIWAVDADVGGFARMPEGFRVAVNTVGPVINHWIINRRFNLQFP